MSSQSRAALTDEIEWCTGNAAASAAISEHEENDGRRQERPHAAEQSAQTKR
jgi:hypothetical protein